MVCASRDRPVRLSSKRCKPCTLNHDHVTCDGPWHAPRRSHGSAGRVRSLQLLRAAGGLRRLLRDHLLCVPACCERGGDRSASVRADDGGSTREPADMAAGRRRQQREAAGRRMLAALQGWTGMLACGTQQLLLAWCAASQCGQGSRDIAAITDDSASQLGGVAVAAPPLPGGSGQAPAVISPAGLAEALQQQRCAALAAELAACAAAAARLGMSPHKAGQLIGVITELRTAEGSLWFQARLARDAAAVAGAGDSCDESAFAYGSTPLDSWLSVYEQPEVAAAVRAALCAGGSQQAAAQTCHGQDTARTYMVWGSSCGWLVFYFALVFGWSHCVGFDLLPCLVHEARRVAQQLGAEGEAPVGACCRRYRGVLLMCTSQPLGRLRSLSLELVTRCALPDMWPFRAGVSFNCGDLLGSCLEGVGVLQVTEQCWPEALLDKVGSLLQPRGCARVITTIATSLVSEIRGSLLWRMFARRSWHGLCMQQPRTQATQTFARRATKHMTTDIGRTHPLQAAAKIAAELAPGAVVVDYTGRLVKRLQGRTLAVLNVPTSWRTAHMHVLLHRP